MTATFTIQSLQDLLAFPFKSRNGKNKILLAGLFGFANYIIPILPTLFLLGYSGLIMQRMIQEKVYPFLPEWNEWNKFFKLGSKIFGASFVYSFPAGCMIVIGYLAMIAPAFLSAFYDSLSARDVGHLFFVQIVCAFAGIACFGVGLFLSLILSAFLPVVVAHVAATNSFKAAFHIKDWWKILRVNLGGFFVTLIILGGLYMVLVLAIQLIYMTVILCLLIPFLFSFIFAYLLIIANVLFAQAYREALEKLAASAV